MIATSQQGPLGLIELKRPAQINACTISMCKMIHHQLNQWEPDPSIHVIILFGEGTRGFCAGGDLKQLFDNQKKQPEHTIDFFRHEYQLNNRIHTLETPLIALMHGVTMGGGVGLSHYAQRRVAAANLAWAMPETRIGFFPDVGMSYTLSRLPQYIGRYLALTGITIDANTAHALGLIDEIVETNSLKSIINALINLKTTPETIIQQNRIEPTKPNLPVNDIQQCFQHNLLEEIFDALNSCQTPWSKDTLNVLKKRSPLSLHITLEALKRAETMDQQACFAQDFTLCQSFLKHPDFYEGIRAAIIDKDHNPQWQPLTEHWRSFFESNDKHVLF